MIPAQVKMEFIHGYQNDNIEKLIEKAKMHLSIAEGSVGLDKCEDSVEVVHLKAGEIYKGNVTWGPEPVDSDITLTKSGNHPLLAYLRLLHAKQSIHNALQLQEQFLDPSELEFTKIGMHDPKNPLVI